MADRDEDAVGYKRPPLHTRFKPGQSGNPKGRPKGKRNLRQEVLDELLGQVTIKENGRPVTVSKARAMVKALVGKAAAGDIRAIQYLVDLGLRLDAPEDADTSEITPDDEAILAAYHRKLAREGGHE